MPFAPNAWGMVNALITKELEMLYAKLASLLPLLLIQSQQSAGNDLLQDGLFKPFEIVLFSGFFFALAVISVVSLTVFFGGFALPPVLGMQWLYRGAVLRWMNRPGGSARATQGRPSGTQTPTRAASNLQLEVIYPETYKGPDSQPLNRRAAEASRVATRIYVTAATVYAVAMTPLAVYFISNAEFWEEDFVSVSKASFYLSTFLVLMWLPVLMYLVMAVARRRRKLFVVAAYSLLLQTPTFFLSGEEAMKMWVMLTFTWIVLMAAPTGTIFVLRFSGVGGLALGIIFSFAAPALSLGLKFMMTVFDPATNIEPPDSAVLASVGLLLVGPVVAALLALALLWWMSHRYARKKTSEQMLLLDGFWLVTTFIVSIVSYMNGAGWYTLTGLLAFALYEFVVWVGLRRQGRATREDQEFQLLLLRVFGSKRRSEWLLKRLGYHWLYAGTIQLIAAPDLAAANLDLDELLDFARGRLKSRFVKDSEDCARRVESLDVHPDPDGRYRVNEFFCHDDVWRETVAALTARSDAVLMDLRGFTRKNLGCAYELHHLVDAVAVNRLVIVVNDATDHDFVRETFDDAWAKMGAHSPNRDLGSPVLRLLHIRRQDARAVRRLLSMLGEAAESETREASAAEPAHTPVVTQSAVELQA